MSKPRTSWEKRFRSGHAPLGIIRSDAQTAGRDVVSTRQMREIRDRAIVSLARLGARSDAKVRFIPKVKKGS